MNDTLQATMGSAENPLQTGSNPVAPTIFPEKTSGSERLRPSIGRATPVLEDPFAPERAEAWFRDLPLRPSREREPDRLAGGQHGGNGPRAPREAVAWMPCLRKNLPQAAFSLTPAGEVGFDSGRLQRQLQGELNRWKAPSLRPQLRFGASMPTRPQPTTRRSPAHTRRCARPSSATSRSRRGSGWTWVCRSRSGRIGPSWGGGRWGVHFNGRCSTRFSRSEGA